MSFYSHRAAIRSYSKKSSAKEQRNRSRRSLKIELLEPRIVFSHNGTDPDWATLPEGGDDDFPLGAATGPNVNANPAVANGITYTTLANGMPILNSYPSARGTIFLDFDGGNYHGSFQAEPYDVDGDPTTFNLDEQATIVEAWRQVNVYFGMFNVNVTTVQPTNLSTNPTAWLVVGNNVSGGTSYVNVFGNSRPESRNQSSHARTRISGITHELGHNFGNWHTSRYDSEGNKAAEYHGQFDALHGPLMGLDYSGIIHKWTTWHSSTGVANLQDDMAIIASDLGKLASGQASDGYKPDDFAGTIATATPLLTSGITQYRAAIIERLTDADAFSFTSTGGAYNITVGRDNPSGVDVKISVYDSTGKLIAFEDGDPTGALKMVNDAQVVVSTTTGTYYVVVESHGNYGDQGMYVVRVDPMATNWQATDIGLNQVPGYSSYDAATGTYTIAGSGKNIWSTSDGFQYAYQTLTGDGSITAKVTFQGTASNATIAGLMMRESLDAGSKHVLVNFEGQSTINAEYRTSTNGSTSFTGATGTFSTPYWLRLTRFGNTFTAQISSNGTSWTTVTTRSVTMGSTIYVGLASSAVDDGSRSSNFYQLNAAKFTNVALTGTLNFANIVANPNLTTPTGLSVTSATSTSVAIAWAASTVLGDTNGDRLVDIVDYNNVKNNFGGSGLGDTNGDGVVNIQDFNNVKNNFGIVNGGPTGYIIERSLDGITYARIGTTLAAVTTYTDSGLSDAQRYVYRVRASNGLGASQTSVTALATTRAGAITGLNIIVESTTRLIIDWNGDASGETGFRLERSPNGTSNWTTVTTLGKNVPMYVNDGLSTGTQYFYRVVTRDAAGDSATSAIVSAFTKLPAVTGLQFTTKAANQMAISWTAVAGAASYRVERATDTVDWTTVSSSQTGTTYTDNTVQPLGQYYYRVTAVNGTNTSLGETFVFAATPPAAANVIASPWSSADVGSVGGTGAAGISGSTYTIIASGTDIWNEADQFRYVYLTLPGNGSITARVASISPDDDWTWAGVMIRATGSPSPSATGAKYAATMISPNHGTFSQSRSSTNGSSVQTAGPVVDAPYWVKIERTISGSSSIFTFSVSPNGTTWTAVGTQTTITSMSGSVLIGLVVSAVDNADLDKVTFDNVTVVGVSGVPGSPDPEEGESSIASSSTSTLGLGSTNTVTSASKVVSAIPFSSVPTVSPIYVAQSVPTVSATRSLPTYFTMLSKALNDVATRLDQRRSDIDLSFSTPVAQSNNIAQQKKSLQSVFASAKLGQLFDDAFRLKSSV